MNIVFYGLFNDLVKKKTSLRLQRIMKNGKHFLTVQQFIIKSKLK